MGYKNILVLEDDFIITPNINELPKIKIISRDDALKKSKRVKIDDIEKKN